MIFLEKFISFFILLCLIGCALPPSTKKEVTPTGQKMGELPGLEEIVESKYPTLNNTLKFNLELSEIYISRGEYQKALETLSSIQENQPLLAKAYLGLGEQAEEKKLWAEAISFYRKAILNDPALFTYLNSKLLNDYSQLSLYFIEQNDLPNAAITLQEGLNVFPGDKDFLLKLGEVYAILKKYSKAIKAYEIVLQSYPDLKEEITLKLAPLYLSRGDYFLNKAEYQKALELFKKAMLFNPLLRPEIEPRLLSAHNSLGEYYFKNKLFDPAENEWRQVLKIAPENKKAQESLGNLYFLQKRFDEAEQIYQKLLERFPEQANFNFVLGNIYWELKDFSKALPFYKKALELNEDEYFPLHKVLGDYYFDQNEYSPATEEYTGYLRFKKEAEVYFKRGLAFRKIGSYSKALKDFNRAVDLDEIYWKQRYEYGWIFNLYRVIPAFKIIFIGIFSVLVLSLIAFFYFRPSRIPR